MTYHNAVKFVASAHDSPHDDYFTDRISYLATLLSSPQKKLKYIRIAGSNGKTICSAMLSSVLSRAGYRICTLNMSSSGELSDKIHFGGLPLSITDITALIDEVHTASVLLVKNIEAARSAYESSEELPEEYRAIPSSLLSAPEFALRPSGSEIILLAALLFYHKQNCDLCIIEGAHNDTGPSLFLKAPFAAIICGAIPSKDKKQLLKIKTYIRKGVSEVVSAPQDAYAYKMISDTCAAVNCRLSVPIRSALKVKQLSLIGTTFVYNSEIYRLSLCGRFQTTNAITVIETLKMLRRHGYTISDDAEKTGIASVKVHSRFEVLSANPTIIVDSTYKKEALEPVCESLFDFSEVTGRNISLCLPDDRELIEAYIDMLSSRGYKIVNVYSISKTQEELKTSLHTLPKDTILTCFPTPKSAARHMISALDRDSMLLISGNNAFTDQLRLEVVRYLEY